VIFEKNFKKSVFKIKNRPYFEQGQMMILSETRKFILHLFGITYRKKEKENDSLLFEKSHH